MIASLMKRTLGLCLPALACLASAQVLTSQNDNARTSANVHETILTPGNVNERQFGKIFSLRVDGDVYAQPLYLPNVEIPGKGRHNVLYVATEHDSVYAFDADRADQPLWRVSFLDPKAGVSTVAAADVICPFIRPEIGITATPAIELESGTLYVLSRAKVNPGLLRSNQYTQTLHALAITTGQEKFGGPVDIRAPGFDALRELPRAGLLLANGQVYLTWASSCDVGPYHGWVMAYDAHTLAQTAVFNTSPGASESGIWQSDTGPAADAQGRIYVATGNGAFHPGHDWGDSILKLALEGRTLNVRGSFTPENQAELNAHDLDLGSGGPMLTPGGLLVVGGKEGMLYVLDCEHLGQPRQAVELRGGIYAAPAYWNGHVFVLASDDYLADFTVTAGGLSKMPVAMGRQRFGNPGATPAISADGKRNGIVWLIDTKAWNGDDRPAVLHAYDATDVDRELYNREQIPGRDRVGLTLRFTIPTVVNGRVYVDAKRQVDVYGLLPE
jgi:outer membrane protein assembly factor BamB